MTARLIVLIDGTGYRLWSSGPGRWRLRKSDGTTYDLAPSGGVLACDCGDYAFRREGLDPGGCKHARALRQLGLAR